MAQVVGLVVVLLARDEDGVVGVVGVVRGVHGVDLIGGACACVRMSAVERCRQRHGVSEASR